MTALKFIKGITHSEFESHVKEFGYERYRADQVFHALYIKRINNFAEITSIPFGLRKKLEENYIFNALKISQIQKSKDGSVKYLFELHDGLTIESVLMPEKIENKRTVCISTQVGCPLACKFCATGALGFKRDLDTAEIIEQVLQIEKFKNTKVTNIVMMGMGEPLLNYQNVVKAIDILTSDKTNIVNSKKLTVSTVGIPSKIKELANEKFNVKLAISLHATTNGMRQKLIPSSKKMYLEQLLDSIEYYYKKKKIPITYEYILFEGINDSPADAKRLAKISRRVSSKVNIIPYNNVILTKNKGNFPMLRNSPKEKVNEFIRYLRNFDVVAIVRESFGSDIAAACGQLAGLKLTVSGIK